MRPAGGPNLAALASFLLLAACGRLIPLAPQPPAPGPVPVTPVAATGLMAGVVRGPSVVSLGLGQTRAAAALSSFRESCPRLLARTDNSGITQQSDWSLPCQAAGTWPVSQATSFFERHFETAQVGDGKAFATGYYEPEIAGVRERRAGFDVPIYRMPPDLVRAKPEDAPPNEAGQQPLGRYDETGKFVPYYSRAEIELGVLDGKGLEVGWAADPIEVFFLQVQGSGRLIAPDGKVVRIGYAGQNGLPYTGIGSVMRQKGLIGSGPGQVSGSMQGIMQWLRANPEEGKAMMRQNQSWVFFRELTGNAPLGALNVPVRGRTSLAADPKFVPLGAPVWLELDRPEANGLWVAQDTGGAIKGANRFDTFWGAGSDARTTAGGMSGRGKAWLLLPKVTLNRLENK